MSIRRKSGQPRPRSLCLIDQIVLEAQREGRSWKGVPGMRSEARFQRTLDRARWRSSHGWSLAAPLLSALPSQVDPYPTDREPPA